MFVLDWLKFYKIVSVIFSIPYIYIVFSLMMELFFYVFILFNITLFELLRYWVILVTSHLMPLKSMAIFIFPCLWLKIKLFMIMLLLFQLQLDWKSRLNDINHNIYSLPFLSRLVDRTLQEVKEASKVSPIWLCLYYLLLLRIYFSLLLCLYFLLLIIL